MTGTIGRQLLLEIANAPCVHTITQSRHGETGSWCLACGVKVWAVHDRPCQDCRHSRQLSDGWMCGPKLMAISACMKVTYRIGASARDCGLCFEAKDNG